MKQRLLSLGFWPVCLLVFCLGAGGALRAAETVYLAVGAGGHRMFSPDGLTWDRHAAWGEPAHDQNDLNVAVFFKGAAYAGGGYSIARLAATRDGRTWSEGVLPNGSPIFGLEVMNETLYAITLRGQVYASQDGENFTLVAKAEMPTPTHWIRRTTQGNGLILGGGDYGPLLAFQPSDGRLTITQTAGQGEKNAGLRRVAFGNGVFVVGGQDGLLARTRDGLKLENNVVQTNRGNIASVVWTGRQFLATGAKGALVSTDGLAWQSITNKVPSQVVEANGWLYGWSWPPHKLSRSRDGLAWEPVPNERQWHVKHVAFGQLAGSATPPKLPPGRVPPAGQKKK